MLLNRNVKFIRIEVILLNIDITAEDSKFEQIQPRTKKKNIQILWSVSTVYLKLPRAGIILFSRPNIEITAEDSKF